MNGELWVKDGVKPGDCMHFNFHDGGSCTFGFSREGCRLLFGDENHFDDKVAIHLPRADSIRVAKTIAETLGGLGVTVVRKEKDLIVYSFG